MNAYSHLSRTFAARPQAILLQSGQRQLCAADIEQASARHAAWLSSLGLTAGDRVLLQAADTVEALLLYLGVLRAGCVFVPLATAWPETALADFVDDAQPRLILCEAPRQAAFSRLIDAASGHSGAAGQVLTVEQAVRMSQACPATAHAAIPEPQDTQTALILHTSGRSGQPHGARVSHARLAAQAEAITERWQLSHSDRLLAALPMFSMQGLCIAVQAILGLGGRLMLPASASATAEESTQATVLLGTPRVYGRLLADPALPPAGATGIRLYASACGPLRKAVAQAFAQRSGLAPRQCYGSPEAGLVTADFPDARFRIGTVGKVLEGRRLRIVGSNLKPMPLEHLGEIQLPEFEGWWGRPDSEACTSDGWFRTGDIGMYDEEDFISICGRTDDRFVSGYYTMDPEVIEAVLETLPGVAEAVVIDTPDPALKARAIALVVTQAGAAVTEAGILEGLRQGLPSHLIPAEVRFVPPFPRNPLGHVQRNRLRASLNHA
jgi:malonyl-CoA/methylmalonyl-CoA synthetase